MSPSELTESLVEIVVRNLLLRTRRARPADDARYAINQQADASLMQYVESGVKTGNVRDCFEEMLALLKI